MVFKPLAHPNQRTSWKFRTKSFNLCTMLFPVNFVLCVIIANRIVVADEDADDKACRDADCDEKIEYQLENQNKASKDKPLAVKLPLTNAGNANCFLAETARVYRSSDVRSCPKTANKEITYDIEVVIEGLKIYCNIKQTPEPDMEKTLYNTASALAALMTGTTKKKIDNSNTTQCTKGSSKTSKKVDLYPEISFIDVVVKFAVVMKGGQTKIATTVLRRVEDDIVSNCIVKDGDKVLDSNTACTCLFSVYIPEPLRTPLVGSLLASYVNENGFASMRDAFSCKF